MALRYDTTGWTEDEVQTIFAAAKASITSGSTVVSWSSAGSSVTKSIPPDTTPSEVCSWCQWMLRALNPEVYGYNRSRVKAAYW